MLRAPAYTDRTMEPTTDDMQLSPVERVYRDHERFRRTLDALQAALRAGTAGDRTRTCCAGLLRQLQAHRRREEPLLAAVPASACTHEEDVRQLQVLLSTCFVEGPTLSLIRHGAKLEAIFRAFRERMQRQEQELFPRGGCGAPEGHAAHGALDGTMTVRHLIAEHPETKSLLECLFVSLPDGPDAVDLDEVAYRRGMDTEELICRLQDVMRRDAVLVN